MSHSEAAIDEIVAFSKALKNTKQRIEVFNADRGILRSPISCSQTKELGFDLPEDSFSLLQGDIVTTESAYFLGERVRGCPKYAVLNSSCDLVSEKREYAALLRIAEIRASEPDPMAKLSLLLKFGRRDAMYLPVMPSDFQGALCNVIQFDGICQIRSADLQIGESYGIVVTRRLADLCVILASGTGSR